MAKQNLIVSFTLLVIVLFSQGSVNNFCKLLLECLLFVNARAMKGLLLLTLKTLVWRGALKTYDNYPNGRSLATLTRRSR